jgi:hypothetical protein
MTSHRRRPGSLLHAKQATLPPLPSLQQPLPTVAIDQPLLPAAGQQRPKQPRADPRAKHLWPKLKR